MRAAIMQPYFLPYIGYFQLIESADVFVVYDNIQYTKKGWINRNRFLVNGKDATFTIALRSDSDYLDVRERELSAAFDRSQLLARFEGAYRRAPYFAETMPVIAEIVSDPATNLFDYLRNSIERMCAHLAITTPIVTSSDIPADHSLSGQDRVLEICRALGADAYVNAAGGRDLYARDDFRMAGVELSFISTAPLEYRQFGAPFVPWLSILDVLMFLGVEQTRRAVMEGYELT